MNEFRQRRELSKTPSEKKYPKLRFLSDRQYEKVTRLARISGIPIETCPTCRSVVEEHEHEDGGSYTYRQKGQYKLRGQTYDCDCKSQILLRKHYLLAGIGDQYMRIDWDKHYVGPDSVKEEVVAYLARIDSFRIHGIGARLLSPDLAVGKTFAATHIGKTLIKQGEKVMFTHFKDMAEAFRRSDFESYQDRVKSVTYLIIDEILPPVSDAQSDFFASKLEDVVRWRTNYNLPTIVTSNMTDEELDEEYPRVYSLLKPKQVLIEMYGDDWRRSNGELDNLELALSGEIRPIV